MSETLSYNAIRTSNQAREADELRAETRRKNLLILVLQYLNDEGFVESAQALSKETNIDLRRFEVCDNVDLHTILMEYESYYYIKFAKYPKVTKKLNQPTTDIKTDNKQKGKGPSLVNRPNHRTQSTPSLPRLAGAANGSDTTPPATSSRQTSAPKNAVAAVSYVSHVLNGNTQQQKSNALAITNTSNASAGDTQQDSGGLSLHGLTLQSASNADAKGKQKQKAGHIIDVRSMINDATRLNVEEGSSDDRLLKPLGGYVGYNSEWRELAQVVSRDIYLQNPDVRWDDIIGLETPKRLVKESVVYPIKYPQLFTGILSPWKGLLLYGPPGTGKTMLAKAVATECNTTFFNISASTIVSKWRGDSEKLVRVLFELARFHAPSTIFLDELDAIMGQRGSTGNSSEHEGSRRMKTELLMQMDGLAKTDDLVFLLAASNLPWELDHAMLRRLEKRILVDLPERAARKAMFLHHLPPVVNQSKHNNGLELHANLDYDLLAEETNGYSGADVRLVCKEAAMRTVRKVFDALENHVEGDLHITLDEIRTADVLAALSSTKPSASKLQAKYMAWQKEFESA